MVGKFSRKDMSVPPGPFETEQLRLVPLGLLHEPAMWEMLSDYEFVRFVPFDHATDRKTSKKLFDKQIKGGERFKFHLGIEWIYAPPEKPKTAGFAMCRPTKDGEKMEIGYCICPKFWGRGLATEATNALVDQVAPAMGASHEDLIAKIHPGNFGSIRVAEKAGFKIVSKEIEEDTALLILHISPKNSNVV